VAEVLTEQQRVLSAEHPDVLATCRSLAELRAEADDPAGAVGVEAVAHRPPGRDNEDTELVRDVLTYWRTQIPSRRSQTARSSPGRSSDTAPSANNRSAVVNFRTTCSGEFRFLAAMTIEPSCPFPGSQTLTRTGPTNRDQATGSVPELISHSRYSGIDLCRAGVTSRVVPQTSVT
jgi:hypothetical protein